MSNKFEKGSINICKAVIVLFASLIAFISSGCFFFIVVGALELPAVTIVGTAAAAKLAVVAIF